MRKRVSFIVTAVLALTVVFVVGNRLTSVQGQAGPTRPGPLEVASWRDSFRSKPMWQLCGGYFVCGCSIALVSTHFVPFAIERGYAPATAATAYGLMRRSACLPISTTRPCSYVNGKRDLIEVRVALAAWTSPWVEYPPRRRDVLCLP